MHDTRELILHSYLTALFSHVAPLALNASIVLEQEYSGVEGDSASCAELYALLSSLSGLPLRQGIAVTGALNQHGEVLPVGGINEKIEGWFQACQASGLDGTQGVLIPARNQRHLMLDRSVQDAVERGLFHVYTMGHVSEGIALLTGEASGMSPAELLQAQADELAGGAATVEDTVMQRAELTLRAYRRACQVARGAEGARRAGTEERLVSQKSERGDGLLVAYTDSAGHPALSCFRQLNFGELSVVFLVHLPCESIYFCII